MLNSLRTIKVSLLHQCYSVITFTIAYFFFAPVTVLNEQLAFYLVIIDIDGGLSLTQPLILRPCSYSIDEYETF